MPTYGYQCTECQHEFQVFQSMKDDPIKACPECTGRVKRLLYPVGIVFKGTGWYVNDSRKPDKSEEPAAPASSGSDTTKPAESKSTEGKSTESKSDTKSDSAAPTAAATKH